MFFASFSRRLPRRVSLGLTRVLFPALALITAGCSKPTVADPVASLNTFFEAIGHGRFAEAYESATFSFQTQQDAKYFEQMSRELELTEMAQANWQSPKVTGKVARVDGEIVAKSGTRIPLMVTLNEVDGTWRVFSVSKPRDVQTGLAANLFARVGKGTAFLSPLDRQPPEPKILQQMTLDTLLQFNEAVATKNFEEFYENISKAWQDQLTLGQVQRAFQSFSDANTDISCVKDYEPVFEPAPYVSTKGILMVSGYYPSQPFRVRFGMKFIYELPRWRLFGITVEVEN